MSITFLRSHPYLLTIVLVWTLAVGGGLGGLAVYSQRPGATSTPLANWPPELSARYFDDTPYRLVMFVHPKCPCTQASVHQLERIVARRSDRVAVYLFVYRPNSAPADWDETSISAVASRIPGATIIPDVEGRRAEQFGAYTSGHLVLYTRDGELAFSGGITSSRGHEGDNRGSAAVLAILDGCQPSRATHEVYGCPIKLTRGAK